MTTWKPVTAHTRARWKGSRIACPCGAETTVFHFAWSAMVCGVCGNEVGKHSWRVAA